MQNAVCTEPVQTAFYLCGKEGKKRSIHEMEGLFQVLDLAVGDVNDLPETGAVDDGMRGSFEHLKTVEGFEQ